MRWNLAGSHAFAGGWTESLWVKDYGAPDDPDRTMYVEPTEIIGLINSAIQ
jgi:hypothetical protein